MLLYVEALWAKFEARGANNRRNSDMFEPMKRITQQHERASISCNYIIIIMITNIIPAR